MLPDSSAISSLIDFFPVKKGDDDIRLVLNESSYGLNKVLRDQSFWLYSSSTMIRSLGYNYKSVDINLEDFFLNFPLRPSLRKHSGINMSHFNDSLKSNSSGSDPNIRTVTIWNRIWLGLKPCPIWESYFIILLKILLGEMINPGIIRFVGIRQS